MTSESISRLPDTSGMPCTSGRGFESHYSIRFTGVQRDRFPGQRQNIHHNLISSQDTEDYPEDFTGEW